MVSVRLEPMSRDEYDAYRVTAERDYADSFRDSGALPEAEAVERAAGDYARILPDGFDTEGHLFWTAYDAAGDDGAVGMLWLHLRPTSEGLTASGYGRAIMVAAEDECRALGVVSVGLNVFGHNRGAQALYEQMGFEVTGIQMSKRLD